MQHATFPDLPDTSSCSRGGGGSCVPLADDPGVPPADMDEEVAASWQDYSEVHLLLRMPRPSSLPAAPAASSKYGGVAEMEELVERLHAALEVKEAQRKAAVDALARRVRAPQPPASARVFGPWGCVCRRGAVQPAAAQLPPALSAVVCRAPPVPQSSEAENLQRVVRELSESRAKEVSQRVTLQARYGEVQSEYARMLRIADLSRTVRWEGQAHVTAFRPGCHTAHLGHVTSLLCPHPQPSAVRRTLPPPAAPARSCGVCRASCTQPRPMRPACMRRTRRRGLRTRCSRWALWANLLGCLRRVLLVVCGHNLCAFLFIPTLQEKVHVLERRVDFEGFQESECKKHLTRNPYRVVETY